MTNPKHHKSPLGLSLIESHTPTFRNLTDALLLDPILIALLEGKPLPDKEKNRLLRFQSTEFEYPICTVNAKSQLLTRHATGFLEPWIRSLASFL